MTQIVSKISLIVVWLVLIAVGIHELNNYSLGASETRSAPIRIPEEFEKFQQEQSCILIMFLHPRCPCSRASLDMLSRLKAQCGNSLSSAIVFSATEAVQRDKGPLSLYTMAHALGDVDVIDEMSGRLAKIFGARISGEVYLYSPEGNLMFHGGITAGRGHSGDNYGYLSVIDAVRNKSPYSESPIFGCELFESPSISKSVSR